MCNFTNPNPAAWLVCLNPQSRFQTTDVLADEALATLKFNTGPVLNTLVSGAQDIGRNREHQLL